MLDATPFWMIPAVITLWMAVWVYLGYHNGDTLTMQMRLIGALFFAGACWLIWYLMDGVRYFY